MYSSSGLILGLSILGFPNIPIGILTVDVLAGATTQIGTIVADQMALTAAGNVDLSSDNDIVTFAAALTGSSSISFNNANALDINTGGTLAGITTAAGNITVTTSPGLIVPISTTGDINVNAPIFAGGTGSIVLNAQYGGDATLPLDAANLTLNSDVNTGGAGGLTLQAAGDVTTTGAGVRIGNTTTGAINLVADADQDLSGTITIAAKLILSSLVKLCSVGASKVPTPSYSRLRFRKFVNPDKIGTCAKPDPLLILIS